MSALETLIQEFNAIEAAEKKLIQRRANALVLLSKLSTPAEGPKKKVSIDKAQVIADKFRAKMLRNSI
jgi:hypothetical protein